MDEDEDSACRPGDEGAAELVAIVKEWHQLEARRRNPGLKQLDPAEEARLWELTVGGIFLFVDELVESVSAGTNVPIPNGIADLLKLGGAGISDALAGALPLAWRPNKNRNKNYLAGSQRVAIRYASAYYALVNAGLISDSTATATICGFFDVGSSTPRSWRKEDNKQQYDVYIDAFSEISGPSEDLPGLRLKAAREILEWAGHLYKRRVL